MQKFDLKYWYSSYCEHSDLQKLFIYTINAFLIYLLNPSMVREFFKFICYILIMLCDQHIQKL